MDESFKRKKKKKETKAQMISCINHKMPVISYFQNDLPELLILNLVHLEAQLFHSFLFYYNYFVI